ncbi:MAG: sn-glycerol-3-phosphate ABC transporter ATP-binding protein UgpC [Bacteroidetes bacterium]|nr:sn-glycerol-3-phosphate ABC transporter ATP-binding protein UgpC [Bacteroidota bacterium]
MAEIRFENVSKIYADKTVAVDNINLTIKDKEFVVLVGPSGCGKSTTLRMLVGLEDISEGKLYIDDKCVNKLPPKDRNIAIVFQNYALYPHMTAYENLAFGLKIKKVKKKEIYKRVMNAAEILEIEDLLGKKPKAMSGGQKQRVAIGRAIVREPKIFLFDEPLSNLDAKLRVQMRIEIAKLYHRLKTTIVYVTHDQVEAMTLGDKIVVMDKGKIQQIGTPENLYTHPNNLFVAGFVGTPPMNIIKGKIISENNVAKFISDGEELTVNLPTKNKLEAYINKEIVMGIRSEDVKCDTNIDINKFATIEREILFIEQLGHEIYVYFELQKKQLISRMKPDHSMQKGKKIKLSFSIEKMYFFDNNTEQLIENAMN